MVVIEKCCAHCGASFVAAGKGWRATTCSPECQREHQNAGRRAAYAAEQARPKPPPSGFWKCHVCRRMLPASEMTRDNGEPSGVGRRCRPCNTAHALAYQQRHPDKRREYQRRWQERHRDRHLAYQREYGRRKRALYGNARVSDVKAAAQALRESLGIGCEPR